MSVTTPPTESHARTPTSERWRLIATLIGAALGYVLVLAVSGLLPGEVTDGPWFHLTVGAIRCVDDLGIGALTSVCHQYGQPLGFYLLSNGPVVYLGAVFQHLGFTPYGAYLLSAAVFEAVAFAGLFLLMRALGTGRAVAVVTATAYLLSPSVVGMQPFGGTFTGFSLLGAYVFADIVLLRVVAAGSRLRIVLAVLGYTAIRVTALFIDGYSFVASIVLSVAVLVAWLISSTTTRRRKLLAVGIVGVANVVAAGLYTRYSPMSLPKSPLEVFRAMGADLSTFALPTPRLWAADALGLARDHSQLWGDGTNANFNYLGVVAVALAVVAVVTRRRDPRVVALAVAGVVALVASIGPALKISDDRPATAAATAAPYAMPVGSADAELPWAHLFTALPGSNEMRATYRWSVLARLVLLVLAALAIDALSRGSRGRQLAAVAIAAIALAELAPNVPLLLDEHRTQRDDAVAFDRATVGDLRRMAAGARHAYFMTYENPYTVNDLATAANVRTYNVGGDKNFSMSASRWPQPVAALAKVGAGPDDVAAALSSGTVDVVVLPYFGMRNAAYFWPPSATDTAAARAAFRPIVTDRRFTVTDSPWLATVRLAPK